MPAIRGLEKKIPYSLFHEISGILPSSFEIWSNYSRELSPTARVCD